MGNNSGEYTRLDDVPAPDKLVFDHSPLDGLDLSWINSEGGDGK